MDIDFLIALQNFRNVSGNFFTGFFSKITVFGESYIAPLTILIFYWAIDKRFGVSLLLCDGIGRWMNGLLKITACVNRPWIRDARIKPVPSAVPGATGYSFPSGHSTNATICWGNIGWQYRNNKVIEISMYLLVALIMLSRLYLGVHTPQDVIVGLLSSILLIVFVRVTQEWFSKDKNDLIYFGIAIAVCIVSFFYIIFKKYPMEYIDGKLIVDPKIIRRDSIQALGMFVGILSGIVFENHIVKFTTETSFENRFARIIAGLLLFVFLKETASPFLKLFIGNQIVRDIIYPLITYFLLVGVYPWIFRFFEERKGLKEASF